jgi:hypothetical protein
MVVLVFCGVAWMGIQYLEYMEFTLASRFLFRGDLQRTVKAQIDLDAFTKSLAAAENPEECCALVRETAVVFGFTLLRAQIAGQHFAETSIYTVPCWRVHVPLSSGDFIELEREADANAIASSAGPFIDALRSSLAAKCQSFHFLRKHVSYAVGA